MSGANHLDNRQGGHLEGQKSWNLEDHQSGHLGPLRHAQWKENGTGSNRNTTNGNANKRQGLGKGEDWRGQHPNNHRNSSRLQRSAAYCFFFFNSHFLRWCRSCGAAFLAPPNVVVGRGWGPKFGSAPGNRLKIIATTTTLGGAKKAPTQLRNRRRKWGFKKSLRRTTLQAAAVPVVVWGAAIASLCLSLALAFCSRFRGLCFGCCRYRCLSTARAAGVLSARSAGLLCARIRKSDGVAPPSCRRRFSASPAHLWASRAWVASSSCGREGGQAASLSLSVALTAPVPLADLSASLLPRSMAGAAPAVAGAHHRPSSEKASGSVSWTRASPLLFLWKSAARVRGGGAGWDLRRCGHRVCNVVTLHSRLLRRRKKGKHAIHNAKNPPITKEI